MKGPAESHGKWTVFIQCLSGISTTQSVFTAQVSIHSFTRTHSDMKGRCLLYKSRPAHQEHIHTHSHTNSLSNFGFSILLKDTLTRRPEDQTTNLLIGRHPHTGFPLRKRNKSKAQKNTALPKTSGSLPSQDMNFAGLGPKSARIAF